MKLVLTFLCVFFLMGNLFANTDKLYDFLTLKNSPEKVDSILEHLSKAPDSAKANLAFKKALEIATQCNYSKGIFLSYDALGVFWRNKSNYAKALALHKHSLEIAEKFNNNSFRVQALNNIGVVYRRIDEFDKAFHYHLKALKLAEKINDVKNICISLNSIGNIYVSLDKSGEALLYFERALTLERKRGNLLGVSINLDNIGCVYESFGEYDKALNYYKSSLDYDIQIKNLAGSGICYNAIGHIYLKKKDFKTAIKYFSEALKISQYTGDLIYVSSSLSSIGNANFELHNYDSAIVAYQKGLSIAKKIGSKSEIATAYYGLYECYQEINQFKTALEFYKNSVSYNDSIINVENLQHVAKLAAQYDKEKKQQQIILLEKDKRASRLYFFIVTLLLFAALIFVTIAIIVVRQRRKITRQELNIKEQKIRELEKERLLIATKSVLQGVEEERGRLAKDLHDGLGGLLSGVKLSLQHIKDSANVTNEITSLFDNAIKLIDDSIRELRYIAHNLMPEALVKFGLNDALSDFCKNISLSKKVHVTYQGFGHLKRLDKSLEISVYRIVQELINNAIKHSKASEILVQIVQDENRFNLTVQDNGIGFDMAIINETKSSGLANIKARIEANSGLLDIFSKPGEGAEFTIELPI